MVVRVAVINEDLFRLQQDAHGLLQRGVLAGAPLFVVTEIQVRVLYTASFCKQFIAQHVRRLV